MTPGARLAAAIEVLDALAVERAAADQVLKAWGREHRFAGSGDRRAIAGHVYDALRARARSQWRLGASDGRALVLGALGLETAEAAFTGEGRDPAPLTPEERARLAAPEGAPPAWVAAGVPEWIAGKLQDRFGVDWLAEAQALAGVRAPVDLRVNALRGGAEAALRLLDTDEVKPERAPWSALGLRLPPAYSRDVQATRAWKTGWVEVQDEASQLAAALADARPGATVVDYCAGGGGKTLALAAAMGGEGRLVATDTDAKRLAALAPRLERAGARADVRRIGSEGEGAYDLQGAADLVFVDAPCTGAGTWRRHPEAAWRLTPETLARLAALQPCILACAARLVRPGGRLAYATCSVFAEENEAVAAVFAAGHPGFRPLPIATAAEAAPGLTPAGRERLSALARGGNTLQMTPHRTGTDGFFLALFERTG